MGFNGLYLVVGQDLETVCIVWKGGRLWGRAIEI